MTKLVLAVEGGDGSGKSAWHSIPQAAFGEGLRISFGCDTTRLSLWNWCRLRGAGHVWEWCSDWYVDKLSGGTDPVGPERGSSRVVRGGGWGNNSGHCRSANRNDGDPSSRNSNLGFRVARSQSAQAGRAHDLAGGVE